MLVSGRHVLLLAYLTAIVVLCTALTGRTCSVRRSRRVTFTAYQQQRKTQKYYTGCGFLGFGRCTRYRVYYTRQAVTRYRAHYFSVVQCCSGWTVDDSGINCNTHDRHPLITFCPPNKEVTATGRQTIVTWQKATFREPEGYGLSVTSTYGGESATLPWGHATVTYVATSANNGKRVTCSFSISVTPPLPKAEISGHLNDTTIVVEEFTLLELECRAEYGKPPPNVTWYRDGVVVTEGTNYTTELSNYSDYRHATSTLSLYLTRADDDVTYECRTSPNLTTYRVNLDVILVCRNRTFGLTCSKMCRCRDVSEQCNVTTGVCESGCEDGWEPPDCQRVCQNMMFGPGCTLQCHCENSREPCAKNTVPGECFSGCGEGWMGETCQRAARVEASTEVLTPLVIGMIGGGAALLVIVGIVVLVVCVHCRRRSNRHVLESDKAPAEKKISESWDEVIEPEDDGNIYQTIGMDDGGNAPDDAGKAPVYETPGYDTPRDGGKAPVYDVGKAPMYETPDDGGKAPVYEAPDDNQYEAPVDDSGYLALQPSSPTYTELVPDPPSTQYIPLTTKVGTRESGPSHKPENRPGVPDSIKHGLDTDPNSKIETETVHQKSTAVPDEERWLDPSDMYINVESKYENVAYSRDS